jgi:hypothetical protein
LSTETAYKVPGVLRPALLASLVFATATASAHAYPWPVKPFHKQHAVGGLFGDPRMVFSRTLDDNGLEGPGVFYFHNGVDIHVRAGTPVYPVTSGTVHLLNGSAVSVNSPNRPTFQYYHLALSVRNGQHVKRLHTVLGHVLAWAGHVHLSEISNGRALNPLGRGRLQPYFDRTRPVVRGIEFRDRSGTPLSPLAVHGKIDVFADAYDLPEPFPGFSLDLPVSPAALSWRVSRTSGRVVVPESTPVDFRRVEPGNGAFWRVYGRGTYPNGPVFGGQLYKRMPGRYLFRLTPFLLDTRALRDGSYVVTVTARDVRGNRDTLSERFTVLNGRA